MRFRRTLVPLACGLIAALASIRAAAQTTDGYHAIQIFPVVVDTASFAQRFTFRNPNPNSLTLRPQYFPASGTSATILTCPDVVIPASASATVTSLRALCPALPIGSQFGFLYTSAATPDVRVYAGFSRVANPQGQGFSVEAFPAQAFTSATSVVSGIRRLAATPNSPALQTNCFVGNLNEVAAVGSPPVTPVHYTVRDPAGVQLGAGDVMLAPGQMLRLLDVFSVAPAGDYPDASVRFEELGSEEPGILAFCTVQDNTSFGADFRIAKQELADAGDALGGTVVGPQDNHDMRVTQPFTDNPALPYFGIQGSGNYYSAHVFYFHHPDYLSCYLRNPATGLELSSGADDLEMRLLDPDGQVIAGGNDVTAFQGLYLGDKTDRSGGASGPYRLEVEDADKGFNFPIGRLYQIICASGSGHTLGERVEFNQSPDKF